MILSARAQDDLNWKIEGDVKVFEFDLGLSDPFFPLEDELTFQAMAAALNHFRESVFPSHPDSKAVLYRGSADFSAAFKWTERQLENYAEFKSLLPKLPEEHLKKLFCASAYVSYFQMLAHKLPDEMPIRLILTPPREMTPAYQLHLLSSERFQHFELETGLSFESNIGICFPEDSLCNQEILDEIDEWMEKLPHFRPVYEPLLTQEWDGLDEIIVFEKGISPSGRRKLAGFEAAGGVIRGRGI